MGFIDLTVPLDNLIFVYPKCREYSLVPPIEIGLHFFLSSLKTITLFPYLNFSELPP